MAPGYFGGLSIYGPELYNDDMAERATEGGANQTAPQNPGDYSGPLSDRTVAGEPFAVWVGMFALLFLVGWYGRHADTLGGEIPRDLRVGFYNWLAVGMMAATFFIVFKVLFTRYKVPGVTAFFQAL